LGLSCCTRKSSLMKYILSLVFFFAALGASAKDYPASLFGIRGDGVTLNTRSIQFAIDYVAGNGGGRLVFDVGRYLTGSIHLKSGVTIVLQEGAVIVGSLNPFDYDKKLVTALIFAYDQHDIAIEGKGVIDGQGRQLAYNVADAYHKGLIKDLFRNGPAGSRYPRDVDRFSWLSQCADERGDVA
jgi:polygalacturonase